MKSQADEINLIKKSKEELVKYSLKRQDELNNEVIKVRTQLDELRGVFKNLKDISESTNSSDKETLYEIIKDKNNMEIQLEESNINNMCYKVFIFSIVFFPVLIGIDFDILDSIFNCDKISNSINILSFLDISY